jgi:iron complex outermembrane recepter protein
MRQELPALVLSLLNLSQVCDDHAHTPAKCPLQLDLMHRSMDNSAFPFGALRAPSRTALIARSPFMRRLPNRCFPARHFAPKWLLCAIAYAFTPWVAAQTSTPPPPTPEKTEVGRLETVTVTAERRAENIKDVPLSVTALRAEKLDIINSGGQDIRMLAARVPSLNIESSFGRAFPRFYIRGLGNGDFDINASQPVSLVYDDVVQENPILKGFPIFDLDRIEVLRGPQGTMFGRNSPAGVIKFESARPRFTNEGYANIGLGKDSAFALEGAVNTAVNKELAVRLSLQSQTRDDWVTNTYAAGPTRGLEGYRDNAFRVQALYKPNADTEALLNVHHRDLNGSARVFRANIIQPGSNELVGGFDPERASIDGVNDQNVKNTGGSLRIKFNLGATTLHSITGYETVKSLSRGDIDGGFGATFLPVSGPGFIPFAAESADGLPKHKQFSQEVRLESNARTGPRWLLGAYYFNEKLTIDSFNYDSLAPGNPLNGVARQNQENKAYALFGSIAMDVLPALNVRAGLRYTRDDKDFTADRITAPPFSPTFLGRRSANTSASDTSWDLSGTYRVSPETNLYARVAKGFRAPSIQGRLLFGDTLSVADSETVTSFEVGMKAELFQKRARVSANLFRYEVKDQQLTAVGGAANFNRLINAAKTQGQGAEIDLEAYLTENLLISVGGSINDTKIKDPNLRVQVCGAGCTFTNRVVVPAAPFTPAIVSVDGNPLPQAPKYVANFTLRYGIPLGNGELFVFTDWAYRSKINFFLYEAKEYTGKALTEGGLRVGYKWQEGKYEAAIYGRNITDQVRVVGGIDFNNLTGFINEPRFWGVQFKAVF